MTDPAPIEHRRRLLLVAAAAAVALLVAGAAVVVARRDTTSRDAGNDTAPAPITVAPPGGATAPDRASLGSCVERYDLTTLTRRETAFDGTVDAVGGDRITFTVNRWYRGGPGARVTLAGASTLAGVNSAGPGASLQPGTRLLVAGDGGFAWSCGFTQPYDTTVAMTWAQALAG